MSTHAGFGALRVSPQPDAARLLGVLDVAEAQRRAGDLCRDVGFGSGATFDVMNGVSELGQHLVRHGRGALLCLHALEGQGRSCLMLVSEFCQAACGPRGSRPPELSAVLKGMDEVTVSPGDVTRVVAIKWGARESGPKTHAAPHRLPAH